MEEIIKRVVEENKEGYVVIGGDFKDCEDWRRRRK